jgi:hypothetical protein
MARLFVSTTLSRDTPTRFHDVDGGAAKGVGLRVQCNTRGAAGVVDSAGNKSNLRLRPVRGLLLALETGGWWS